MDVRCFCCTYAIPGKTPCLQGGWSPCFSFIPRPNLPDGLLVIVNSLHKGLMNQRLDFEEGTALQRDLELAAMRNLQQSLQDSIGDGAIPKEKQLNDALTYLYMAVEVRAQIEYDKDF